MQKDKTTTAKTFDKRYGFNCMLDMVWIEGGSFMMGSPESEEGRFKEEGPVREVRLDGFWISSKPVTQFDYMYMLEVSNPSCFCGIRSIPKSMLDVYWLEDNEPHTYKPKLPVEQVSWFDAMKFCRAYYKWSDGVPFNLPTEAQWEYACRAGSITPFCFGDDPAKLGEHAWYEANSAGKTHEVGQKKPNAWGLYDMHGNVWEWCKDWFEPDTCRSGPVHNPVGPEAGQNRVIRGGAYGYSPNLCRSAYRGSFSPYRGYKDVGFRVVVDPNRAAPSRMD